MSLDIAFQSYEQGETQCPICGEALALAKGTNGTYRTCVTKGCYSRSLNDPPLKESKLVCSNCGGDLHYGTWGDSPAWRCNDNTRHRILLHRNHLKLPAMMAMLGGAERIKLDKRYAEKRS